MEKELRFTDFLPSELVGQIVVVNSRYSYKISKVTRVTKVSFGIENEDWLFDIKTGRKRGDSNSFYSTWAKLITESEATDLKIQWKEKREIKEMGEEIIAGINSKLLTHTQLSEMIKFI